VATNGWLTPIASVNPSGVTVMETMLGAVTVSEVDCETPPKFAEMLVEPAAAAETNPVALMVAVALEDELQVTSAVRSALLPSL
jgi:hypothetical protein